ncbi:oxidoreductase [Mycobacterium sp. djl-10]|nr:oxidoreductase [Mycobacterium sp. djl-10]
MTSSDLITTPFDATSTAAEVLTGVDLSGKRALVTGAASGIGIETARALAFAGAVVTLAVRNTAAGEKVAADIGKGATVAPLDLSEPASVAAFVRAWDGPLDILVNNAGVMAIQDRQLSSGGHEMQFATNHLGHFALTTGLHSELAATGGARVVSVSSSGHLRSPVVFDDINFRFREYDPFSAYGQSKTANVLFAVGITERWADDGITANALMPGGIMTALQRHLGTEFQDGAEERFRRAGSRIKTPEQGAATSVLLAGSPHVDGVSGRYFEDCREATVVDHRDEFGITGVAPYALDRDNAQRLWDVSTHLTS